MIGHMGRLRTKPRHLFLARTRPPGPATQMPRDERGWRVEPAPDGRGTPEAPAPRPPHRTRWFVWLVALLLAINFGVAVVARPSGQTRVTVAFSPYFVNAVRADHVASIASIGDTIQGTFR